MSEVFWKGSLEQLSGRGCRACPGPHLPPDASQSIDLSASPGSCMPKVAGRTGYGYVHAHSMTRRLPCWVSYQACSICVSSCCCQANGSYCAPRSPEQQSGALIRLIAGSAAAVSPVSPRIHPLQALVQTCWTDSPGLLQSRPLLHHSADNNGAGYVIYSSSTQSRLRISQG